MTGQPEPFRLQQLAPSVPRADGRRVLVQPGAFFLLRGSGEPGAEGVIRRQELLFAVEDGRVGGVGVVAVRYLLDAEWNQERVVQRRVRISLEVRLGEIGDACLAGVARFIVFGSFVTQKPHPSDVDVFLLMQDTVDVSEATGEAAIVFDHSEARSYFGASIFWVRRFAALGGEAAAVESWQLRRDGGRRGVVEVMEEVEP